MLSGVKLTYESDADSIQVTGHVPTLLQMMGTGAPRVRTKNEKVTNLYLPHGSAYQND